MALYSSLNASLAVAEPHVPASLASCSKVSNDAARLRCFDQQVAQLSASDTAAVAATSASPLTPEQKVGLSKQAIAKLEPKAANPEPSELHAHIVRTSNDGSGHMLFILDNAQVWRQADADPNFIARSNEVVAISAGALGSFWLAVNTRSAIKVKRLR